MEYPMQSPSNNYFHLHGEIVQVVLLDHAIDDRPFACTVFGILVEEDELTIKIRYWHCNEKEDDDHNHEHIVIVKGAIEEVRLLS